MTEQERREAINNLENLRKQGILSDDEYIQKVSRLKNNGTEDALRNASRLAEQSEYHPHDTAKDESTHRKKTAGMSSGGKAVILLLLVALVCLVGYGITDSSRTGNSSKGTTSYTNTSSSTSSSISRPTSTPRDYLSQDIKSDAMTYAQAYVKTQLKAPSTAKFSSLLNQYTITRSGDQYTVKGYVDAQNSFGAQIRSNFECCFSMTYNGKKIETKLIYITID